LGGGQLKKLTTPKSESNPRCFLQYVIISRPSSEVVKEGRILKKSDTCKTPLEKDFQSIRLNLNKGRWHLTPLFS